MKKKILTTVILLLSALTSGSLAASTTPTMERIKESGIIKLGYRQDIPPISFTNKNDKPAGYSIDLCSAIVAKLQKSLKRPITAEYIPVTAENRFEAINHNAVDLLCGSTTNTLTRQEQVDFTMTTFVTGGSYLTMKGSNIKHNFDGKKIGVVKNTTAENNLKILFQETNTFTRLVAVDSAAEALSLLVSKQIDAFASDQAALIGLMIGSGAPAEFELLPDLYSYEPYALALRKNDSEFRLVANKALAELFRSGEIKTIYNKWFGKYTQSIPPIYQALIQINSLPE